MKTRIVVAVVLLPVVFAVLFFLPPIYLAVLMALITGIAAFELMRTVAGGSSKRIFAYAIVAAASIPFGV